MANFDDQVMGLTGLTISGGSSAPSQPELTQFLTDGAKEIINLLPGELKEKAMSITNLYIGNTDTIMDLDGKGEIFYVTRENADSGVYAPCRKINAMYGDLTNDSENIIYGASATDPVYYVESNSSGNSTLFVKPTPTAAQPAKVYHIAYPSVAYNDSAIANFPDEAEYLVPLYGSIKALQSAMGAMQTNTAIDTTALGAVVTELNKVDDIIVEASNKIDAYYTSIGDIDDTTELWDSTNKRFTVIRDALLQAQNLIDNDQPNAAYDAYANLADIDGALSAMDAHLADEEAILTNDPTSGHISDVLGLIHTAVDQAATAADKFIAVDSDSVFGDESTFLTDDSQLARVKDALDNAEKIIDDGANSPTGNAAGDAATYLYTEEDTELLQGTISIASSEISRAQAHLQEWTSIGDMRVKEINAALSEAQGYTQEIQAHLSYAQAYVNAANARRNEGDGRISQLKATLAVASQELQRGNLAIAEINTIISSYRLELEGVPLHLQEASSIIAQAQGYIAEANVRMQRDDQKYKWYDNQYNKLKQDYMQGIQALKGDTAPSRSQQ